MFREGKLKVWEDLIKLVNQRLKNILTHVELDMSDKDLLRALGLNNRTITLGLNLEIENTCLKAEVEYSKKLRAVVQARKNQK